MSESKKAIVGVAHCFGKVCQEQTACNGGDRRTSPERAESAAVSCLPADGTMNPNIVYFPFGREANVQQFSRQVELKPACFRPTETSTTIIFGVARGGTTMAARVVSSLGVDLAEGSNINFEDEQFNLQKLGLNPKRDEQQLKDHLLKLLEQRNSQHNHWGWKYPNAAAYLPLILERVRNPRLICILRDPLASSSRELRADAIQQQGNEERRLRQAMRAMDTNIALIHQNAHPTLMVSYEKAIQKPAPFVRALALFLGIEPTAQAIDAALGQIQPGGYLQG